MCFGSKSSRVDLHADTYQPPRPVDAKPSTHNVKKMSKEYIAAPPGPPSSSPHPQGAPPAQAEEYAPPPGPTPSLTQVAPPPPHEEYAPPPGPPPWSPSAPPYHDWQNAVPDTSILPPPPSLGNQRSTTSNATEREALQGKAWCEQNPLAPPVGIPQAALEAIHGGNIGVIRPRNYLGRLGRIGAGRWSGKTESNSPDTCISSATPLYSVFAHSPMGNAGPTTIYYEIKISPSNRREVSLALGFAAAPYPTFRLPGWHRGCLAVHGDDGSKFINDMWGGKPFTAPFQPGQTVGIGMTFSTRSAPSAYTSTRPPIDVEVFFTRNGRRDGAWNLHEEQDAQEDLPVTGLEGMNDLYAAVGTFEAVEFEIVFERAAWLYRV